MVKLQFTNATVKDSGYGLEVNGESLEDMFSVALGTKRNGKSGYNSGLPEFKHNSCNVTVIIDPNPTKEVIMVNGKKYNNLQEVEEDGNSEEIKEANSEE